MVNVHGIVYIVLRLIQEHAHGRRTPCHKRRCLGQSQIERDWRPEMLLAPLLPSDMFEHLVNDG